MNSVKLKGLAAAWNLVEKFHDQDPDDDQDHPEHQALQRRVQRVLPPNALAVSRLGIVISRVSLRTTAPVVIRPVFRRRSSTGRPARRHPRRSPRRTSSASSTCRGRLRGRRGHRRIACRADAGGAAAGSAEQRRGVELRPSGPRRASACSRAAASSSSHWPSSRTSSPPGQAGRGSARRRRRPARAAPGDGRGSADCSDPRWSRPRPTLALLAQPARSRRARRPAAAERRRLGGDRCRRGRSGPAPRISLSRNVSAWSSRVWPTAMRSAPSVRGGAVAETRSATRRAQSSNDEPSAAATLRTSAPSVTNGRSSRVASSRQNASSRSAVGREPWLKCAAPATLEARRAPTGLAAGAGARPNRTRPTARPAHGCRADTARDG